LREWKEEVREWKEEEEEVPHELFEGAT